MGRKRHFRPQGRDHVEGEDEEPREPEPTPPPQGHEPGLDPGENDARAEQTKDASQAPTPMPLEVQSASALPASADAWKSAKVRQAPSDAMITAPRKAPAMRFEERCSTLACRYGAVRSRHHSPAPHTRRGSSAPIFTRYRTVRSLRRRRSPHRARSIRAPGRSRPDRPIPRAAPRRPPLANACSPARSRARTPPDPANARWTSAQHSGPRGRSARAMNPPRARPRRASRPRCAGIAA